MGRHLIDITGGIFGKWTVIRFTRSKPSRGALFWCVCACGTEREVAGHPLRRGESKSCGCDAGATVRASAVTRRSTMVEPPPVPGARWLQLTRGKFALVDEDIFNELSCRVWRWQLGGRSTGHVANGDGKTLVYLHHVVLGVDDVVDHRNNDGLDCRRENLRVADKQKNSANRAKFVGASGRVFTSKYKGVVNRALHIKPGADPWTARIRVDGRLIWIGRYAAECEAAVAYDCAAIHHFKEFARTNFPWKDVA